MKNFKLSAIFAFMVLFLLTSVSVFAQKNSNKTPEERAQKRADMMKESLTLSDEQRQQVYDILLSHITEADGIRSSSTVDEDKSVRREKMKTLREATHNRIKEILTAEQNEKLEKIIQEKKGKFKDGRNKQKNKKG